MAARQETVLIVGASVAGCAVAEALRAEGFTGRIILAGEEAHPPYDRPPLSKQVLKAEWPPEQIILRTQARLLSEGVELRLGMRALKLDMERGEVGFSNGETLGYDKLVIATGVRARTLRQVPNTVGVHHLRTLDDAIALRDAVQSGGRVVIAGAGFIGLEVAASSAALGCQVTVVELQPVPLAEKIGATLGARVQALHETHGVTFHLRDAIERIDESNGKLAAVHLRSGRTLAADILLIGIGTVTNDEWLEGSGLQLHNGVLCDAYCAAAPNIWAVGDIANFYHSILDRHIRIEHRSNAAEQALATARNMMGHHEPYAPLPFFWTHQFDVNVQMFGATASDLTPSIVDEDLGRGRFVALYHDQGELVAALGWNAPRQIMAYRQELSARYQRRDIIQDQRSKKHEDSTTS